MEPSFKRLECEYICSNSFVAQKKEPSQLDLLDTITAIEFLLFTRYIFVHYEDSVYRKVIGNFKRN